MKQALIALLSVCLGAGVIVSAGAFGTAAARAARIARRCARAARPDSNRACLRERQYGGREHDRRLRPPAERSADADPGFSVRDRRGRGGARKRLAGFVGAQLRRPVPPRRQRRQRTDLCAPDQAGRIARGRRRRLLRWRQPGQHRRPQEARLRRECRSDSPELHGLQAEPRRRSRSDTRLDRVAAGGVAAWGHRVQRGRLEADRHSGGELSDRQLHCCPERGAHLGTWLAVPDPSRLLRATRERIQSDEQGPAVRYERTHGVRRTGPGATRSPPRGFSSTGYRRTAWRRRIPPSENGRRASAVEPLRRLRRWRAETNL